jgi:glycosyltransferase involved in cell wall biosynthesis
MNVAMLVYTDLAHDARVRKEAATLVGDGHRVVVHVALPIGGKPAPEDVARNGGFETRYPTLPAWVGATGGLAVLRRSARWFERTQALVESAFADGRPDVLHAHDLDTLAPALRAARAQAVPLVYDDHEASYVDKLPNYVPADASGMKRAALHAVVRRLQSVGEAIERDARTGGVTAFVTVSESLADRLAARFGGPRPTVLRNVPLLREVPRTDALRRRIDLPRDARLLLYHGTVTEGSGLETAIRALRLLGDGHVLAIIGRVWRRERYERIAREEHVLDRLRFEPMVPQEELLPLVASADVGLIPTEGNSVGNLYGLPNKLFESMMAGLPVVASDVPEVAAIVRRTGAGLLYPHASPEGPRLLADGVRSLLRDAALWDRCRAAGLAAARDEFNWEREATKLTRLYREIGSSLRRARG